MGFILEIFPVTVFSKCSDLMGSGNNLGVFNCIILLLLSVIMAMAGMPSPWVASLWALCSSGDW